MAGFCVCSVHNFVFAALYTLPPARCLLLPVAIALSTIWCSDDQTSVANKQPSSASSGWQWLESVHTSCRLALSNLLFACLLLLLPAESRQYFASILL
jgi:hypothetical protein